MCLLNSYFCAMYTMFRFKWDKRWGHSSTSGHSRESCHSTYERHWKTVFCTLILFTSNQNLVPWRYFEHSIWNWQLRKFAAAILHFPKSKKYGWSNVWQPWPQRPVFGLKHFEHKVSLSLSLPLSIWYVYNNLSLLSKVIWSDEKFFILHLAPNSQANRI